MHYTVTDKGNGYFSAHVDGMFCITSSSLEAVVEYIELMQGTWQLENENQVCGG